VLCDCLGYLGKDSITAVRTGRENHFLKLFFNVFLGDQHGGKVKGNCQEREWEYYISDLNLANFLFVCL